MLIFISFLELIFIILKQLFFNSVCWYIMQHVKTAWKPAAAWDRSRPLFVNSSFACRMRVRFSTLDFHRWHAACKCFRNSDIISVPIFIGLFVCAISGSHWNFHTDCRFSTGRLFFNKCEKKHQCDFCFSTIIVFQHKHISHSQFRLHNLCFALESQFTLPFFNG